MSWITVKLLGYRYVVGGDGLLAPQRGTLYFEDGIVTDDPTNKRTKIVLAGTAVQEITGAAPIVVEDNPDAQHREVSITAATTSAAGSMSAADKTKLDTMTAGAAVASVAVTAPATLGGTATAPVVGVQAATAGQNGYMSSGHYSRVEARLGAAPVSPAASGGVRLGNAEALAARNAGNTADVAAVQVTAADDLQLGADGADGPDEVHVRAKTGGVLRWFIAGVQKLFADAAGVFFAEAFANPRIGIEQRTSDAATTTLVIAGQAPYASATGTNRNAGDVLVDIAPPAGAGAEGFVRVRFSGADMVRWGRPAGTYQVEQRIYAQGLIRTNDVGSGTLELWSGQLLLSCGTLSFRDSGQSTRYIVSLGTTLTLRADASVTSVTYGQVKRSSTGANPGALTTISAQDGQDVAAGTNNAGGGLVLASGAAGTGGTGGTPGDVDVKTGATKRVEVKGDGSLITLTSQHTRQYACQGVVNTVAGSATPLFNLTLGRVHRMILDGNVTSVTVTGGLDDAEYEFQFLQPAAYTTAWGATWHFPDNLGANPDQIGSSVATMTVWRFRRYSGHMLCTSVAKNISVP